MTLATLGFVFVFKKNPKTSHSLFGHINGENKQTNNQTIQ